ncbi:MAG: metallophosphoesterase family protein [Eubacteriales bacterium]|nr:metallophosphoesterase family protein [Eubacteriales bacterium]
MKKVGIISDTHNMLRPEVKKILQDCDCIIHAGDVCRPEILDEIRWIGDLYVVKGNNDWELGNKLAYINRFSIEGLKFVLVHDKYDLGRDLQDADIVIHGHTHIYSEKIEDERLWLNPGSCGRGRFGGDITMAIMYIDGKKYTVEKMVIS